MRSHRWSWFFSLLCNLFLITWIISTGGPWLEDYEPLNVTMITAKGGLPPLSYWESNSFHFIVPLLHTLGKLSTTYAYVFYSIYVIGVLASLSLQRILLKQIAKDIPNDVVRIVLAIILAVVFANVVYIHFCTFRYSALFVLTGLMLLKEDKRSVYIPLVLIVIGALFRVQVAAIVYFLFVLVNVLRFHGVSAKILSVSVLLVFLLGLVYYVRLNSDSYEVYFDRQFEYALFDRGDLADNLQSKQDSAALIRMKALAIMINDTTQINPDYISSVVGHLDNKSLLSDRNYLLKRFKEVVSQTNERYLYAAPYLFLTLFLLLVVLLVRRVTLRFLFWFSVVAVLLLSIFLFASMYDRVFESFYLVFLIGTFILLSGQRISSGVTSGVVAFVFAVILFGSGFDKLMTTTRMENDRYVEFEKVQKVLSEHESKNGVMLAANVSPTLFNNKLVTKLPANPLYKRCVVLNFYWFGYVHFIRNAFYNEYHLDINSFSQVVDFLQKNKGHEILIHHDVAPLWHEYIGFFYHRNISFSFVRKVNGDYDLYRISAE